IRFTGRRRDVEPHPGGVVKLGEVGDTYQPFVFLVAYKKEGMGTIIDLPITSLWFAYYKDLRGQPRADGTPGRLKLGFGPGGPRVLNPDQLLELLRHMLKLHMVNGRDIAQLCCGAPGSG